MLSIVIAISALAISILGMSVVVEKTGIKDCFIPITLLSTIAMIMYIAGLLNIMPLTMAALYIMGIMLFIRERKRIVGILLQVGSEKIALILIAIIYLFWYCRSGVYADGDTMTHWGVVIREMCELDRMPNFSTREVAYQSYPTGMAGLIYFFCKAFGEYSEGRAMFSQAIFVISCMVPMFVFVKGNNKILKGGVACAAMVYMLHYNVRLDDMKVDNVLALLTLSTIITAVSYRFDPQKLLYLTAPQLCLLQIIKNSGIIFWLFALIPIGYIVFKSKNKKNIVRFFVLSIALPLLTIYLWNCHTDIVFLNADTSRHSASVANTLLVARTRSMEEFVQIIKNFIKAWFGIDGWSNSSGEWPAVISCVVALGTGAFLRRKILKNRKSMEIYFLSAIGLCYLSHKAMLLGMYLFNMPDSDALGIGAYTRYMDSVAIIIYGITICYTLYVWNELEPRGSARCYNWIATVGIVIMISSNAILPCMKSQSIYSLAKPNYSTDGLYRKLVTIQKQHHLPERNAKVLVYTHTPYSNFFVTYCFRSSDAWSIDAAAFSRAMDETPGYYDYLIVTDHDEYIDAELEKYSMSTGESIYFL